MLKQQQKLQKIICLLLIVFEISMCFSVKGNSMDHNFRNAHLMCPDFSVTATSSQEGYCQGQSIQLFGSTSEIGSNYSYIWSGPNGFSSDQQNPVINNANTILYHNPKISLNAA